jgi:hypothetical protein
MKGKGVEPRLAGWLLHFSIFLRLCVSCTGVIVSDVVCSSLWATQCGLRLRWVCLGREGGFGLPHGYSHRRSNYLKSVILAVWFVA